LKKRETISRVSSSTTKARRDIGTLGNGGLIPVVCHYSKAILPPRFHGCFHPKNLSKDILGAMRRRAALSASCASPRPISRRPLPGSRTTFRRTPTLRHRHRRSARGRGSNGASMKPTSAFGGIRRLPLKFRCVSEIDRRANVRFVRPPISLSRSCRPIGGVNRMSEKTDNRRRNEAMDAKPPYRRRVSASGT